MQRIMKKCTYCQETAGELKKGDQSTENRCSCSVNLRTFIEKRVREFEEKFVIEQLIRAEGPAIGIGTGYFKNVKNDIYGIEKFLRSSLQDLLAEAGKEIEGIDTKEHACRFNDGEQNCRCYQESLDDIKALLNPKKESLLEKEDREEYAQALEDEAGELNKQHHY